MIIFFFLNNYKGLFTPKMMTVGITLRINISMDCNILFLELLKLLKVRLILILLMFFIVHQLEKIFLRVIPMILFLCVVIDI